MPAPDASSIWQRNYPNAVNALYHTDNRIISIKALRSQNFSGLKLRSPLSNAHVPNMIYFVLRIIFIISPGKHYLSRSDKTTHIINMLICLVIIYPVRKPDNLFTAKILLKLFLYLLLA